MACLTTTDLSRVTLKIADLSRSMWRRRRCRIAADNLALAIRERIETLFYAGISCEVETTGESTWSS
jgi:hypothetical protein